MTIIENRELTMLPVDALMAHPANPRRGNLKAIAESIKTHGWHGVIVAEREMQPEGKHRILVGKHRWEAAISLGITHVPVELKDVTGEEALRIILADNRASDLAGYADDALLKTLKDIGNLQGTLFDLDAIETLEAKVGLAIVGDVPEFQGQFADAGAEMEKRKEAAEKIAQEMRDVVLVLKPEQFAEFQSDLKALQKRWGVAGVIATTLMAVHKAAMEDGDLQAAEGRIHKMREFGKTVLWAVPHGDRVAFGEAFGLEV